eukprot:c8210_g1_i1.p1 GENE.c8210_g1_i1~~c8210_g1_i1.p1  ORF type:complete len:266 (-),score=21.40 c8210_g1_i1:199-954(-)
MLGVKTCSSLSHELALPAPSVLLTKLYERIIELHWRTLHPLTQTEQKYSLARKPSTIPGASQGLFFKGHVAKHDVMCVYPGVVYEVAQGDPMSFASIRNPYFLHAGAYAIDGCPFGYSAFVYRSLAARDSFPHDDPDKAVLIDTSWLGAKSWRFWTPRTHPTHTRSSLATGHLVNHHPPDREPNAIYVPLHIDLSCISPQQRALVPNMHYSGHHQGFLSCVGVVTIRDIDTPDWVELFTDYHMIADQQRVA